MSAFSTVTPLKSLSPISGLTLENFVAPPRQKNFHEYISAYIKTQNCLIFTGNKQSGKTHMLHAVANILASHNLGFTFTTAPLLLDQLCQHSQANSLLEFRNLLHNTERLIIDDVHLLRRSLALQNMLTTSLPSTTQVIASARHIQNSELTQALQSRLSAYTAINLTHHTSNAVDLLHAYAQDIGVKLSPTEAHNISTSIQDIHTQKALLAFKASRPLIELTPNNIQKIANLNPTHTTYTANRIVHAISAACSIPVNDLTATRPLKQHRKLQDLAIFLCQHHGANLENTATVFKKKNYTSIHHAHTRAKLFLEKDGMFETLHAIESQLQSA